MRNFCGSTAGHKDRCIEVRFNLATALVFNGIDCPEGLAMYRKLAIEGVPDGQVAVGVTLVEGLGVNEDLKEGVGWLKEASARGNPQGQYELGTLYYTGNAEPFIPESNEKAFELFEKAAEQGHMCGMYMCADMLIEGLGVEQDKARAVNLLYEAGERGHRTARYTLLAMLDKNKK